MNNISIEAFIADLSKYDLIIDARSPREYNESHMPNAVNLYALNDEEHKEVGTVYKQLSPFEARVKGAAYVCQNAARHIQALYPTYTPKAKIAIYCARGGMRSSSLGAVFSNIGYRVDKIEGGYKAYRGFVTSYLGSFEKLNFIVLRGNTGCGKSELLKKLGNIVDLEELANHYGSVFGGVNGAQPSQKEFQNRLMHALLLLDAKRSVFIEGESARIGSVMLPKRLSSMMKEGVQVCIDAPLRQRVERTVRMYEHMDKKYFETCMQKITPYVSKATKEEAVASFESGDKRTSALILLTKYYDKVYKKSLPCNYKIYYDDESSVLEELNKIRDDKDKIRLGGLF